MSQSSPNSTSSSSIANSTPTTMIATTTNAPKSPRIIGYERPVEFLTPMDLAATQSSLRMEAGSTTSSTSIKKSSPRPRKELRATSPKRDGVHVGGVARTIKPKNFAPIAVSSVQRKPTYKIKRILMPHQLVDDDKSSRAQFE